MNPETEQALLQADPAGGPTRRGLAYGVLGLLVAGAASTRLAGFGGGPVALPPGRLLVAQLPSLGTEAAEAALADPSFAGADRAALLAALRDRRVRIARMPVFGVADGVGASVRIGCGAFVRNVVLPAVPLAVLLPVSRAGSVTLTPLAGRTVSMGIVQTIGPTPLPPIAAGDTMILQIIVE